jgi:hypothetical protein
MLHVICLSSQITDRTATVHVDGPRAPQLAKLVSDYVSALFRDDAERLFEICDVACRDPEFLDLVFEVDAALLDLKCFEPRKAVIS